MSVLIRSHLGPDIRTTVISCLTITTLRDLQEYFESQLSLPKSPNIALSYQGRRLVSPQLSLIEIGVKAELSLLNYSPAANQLLGGSKVTP